MIYLCGVDATAVPRALRVQPKAQVHSDELFVVRRHNELVGDRVHCSGKQMAVLEEVHLLRQKKEEHFEEATVNDRREDG